MDDGPVEAAPATGTRRRRREAAPTVDPAEFVPLVGSRRAASLATKVSAGAAAFAADRFNDARRMLRPVVEEAPGSVTARELLGLTHYRLGNWREAARQLEAFREVSGGSVEQHPVLADCYRALRRYGEVDALWAELRAESPSAALVTEGRIVAAGAMADRGRLADAVRELEKGWKPPRAPKEHHLRRAYALADLYERVGDLPRARALMGWVASNDPGFADAADRAHSMR